MTLLPIKIGVFRRVWANPRLRPMWSLAVVSAALLLFLLGNRSVDLSLGHSDWFSGSVLAGSSLLLFALPIRKRLILLRLGRVAAWQQCHHYTGLFAIGVFLSHAGLSIDGQLETALAILFWWLSLSGLGHWYFNRVIPRRLANAGPPLRLHEIRPRRQRLAEEAYSAALAAAVSPTSVPVAEFYNANLSGFFGNSRRWSYFIRPSGVDRRRLLFGLERVSQFSDSSASASVQQLTRCIVERDDTDYQAVLMWRIRCWNALHTSATYAFLAVVSIHVAMVLRFSA